MSSSEINVVLLHGFFQDSRVFESVKKRFLKLGFTVHTPDLPGFGDHKSIPKEAHSTLNKINWLVETIKSLNRERLILCGYSMGSRLVLQAMNEVQHLVSAFVIESGTNGIELEIDREKRLRNDARLAKMARNDFEAFQDFWMNHPTLTPIQPICFDDLLRLKIVQSEQDPECVAQSLEQFGTAAMPFLDKTHFEAIQKPVLFMAGEQDKKFASKAAELACLNKMFQLKIIENCGHRIHLEKPSLYVNEVAKFISGVLDFN